MPGENLVPQSGYLGHHKSATMRQVMQDAAKPAPLMPEADEGSSAEEARDVTEGD